MLVKEYMNPNVITIDEKASILEAAELMKKHTIRRFPVMRDKKLVGIVTDRDLRSAAPSQVVSFDEKERELLPELHDLLENMEVREIMSRNVITLDPEDTVVKAAMLMLKHRISGLPVVVGPVLLGIITEGDLFKVLVDFSGATVGRATFAFQLEDRPGFIKEISEVIRSHEGRLASILTTLSSNDPYYRRVYFRTRDLLPERLEELEKVLTDEYNLLYMAVDDIEE
jgi:acetoin utilization protein AcuB